MRMEEIVKIAHEAHPTGLADVFDFEKNIPKVGLIDDQSKALIVNVIRTACNEHVYCPDAYKLEVIAATLEQKSMELTDVVDRLIREAHAKKDYVAIRKG